VVLADKTSELPSRDHWWFMLETVLLGNASMASAPTVRLFREPNRSRTGLHPEGADKHNYIGYRRWSRLPQLQVAQRVARPAALRALEFADLFKGPWWL
jgi:hypothetical protein